MPCWSSCRHLGTDHRPRGIAINGIRSLTTRQKRSQPTSIVRDAGCRRGPDAPASSTGRTSATRGFAWRRLLDLCSPTGTVISGDGGSRDPNWYDNRPPLGLKSIVSAAEPHIPKDGCVHGPAFYRLYCGVGPRKSCHTASQVSRASSGRASPREASMFASTWANLDAPKITQSAPG